MNVEKYYLAAQYPDLSEVEIWTMPRVLAEVEPGDQDWSWRSQFKWLEEANWLKLRELLVNITEKGLDKPLLVGPDGRLWDGHHRLWVLYQLNYRYVPVELAPVIHE